ncbi:hypothetical protein D6D19_03279 [Aureobasidium pullulans]|uniref:Uncharacterized protein n=1 Tax=Aureobasidium pullulans TaxID=5580 RepID=A0A4S9L793_AURPU|nr:hypothetical protein D6D19_03279 [Aureobasidium pullulans]THY24522.1 hypothetical protein D6D02_00763 [Aureobasidium pullulans]
MWSKMTNALKRKKNDTQAAIKALQRQNAAQDKAQGNDKLTKHLLDQVIMKNDEIETLRNQAMKSNQEIGRLIHLTLLKDNAIEDLLDRLQHAQEQYDAALKHGTTLTTLEKANFEQQLRELQEKLYSQEMRHHEERKVHLAESHAIKKQNNALRTASAQNEARVETLQQRNRSMRIDAIRAYVRAVSNHNFLTQLTTRLQAELTEARDRLASRGQ